MFQLNILKRISYGLLVVGVGSRCALVAPDVTGFGLGQAVVLATVLAVLTAVEGVGWMLLAFCAFRNRPADKALKDITLPIKKIHIGG